MKLADIFAFKIDILTLTHDECNSIISICEDLGFRPKTPGISTAPGMRMNKTVHFISTDEVFLPTVFGRISALLPQQLDGKQSTN